MKKWLMLLVCVMCVPHTLACSQIAPVQVFLGDNDLNHDGKLDWHEWHNAQIDDNLQVQFQLNHADFARMDSNRNGYLDRRDGELHSALAYKTLPCVLWQNEQRYGHSKPPLYLKNGS